MNRSLLLYPGANFVASGDTRRIYIGRCTNVAQGLRMKAVSRVRSSTEGRRQEHRTHTVSRSDPTTVHKIPRELPVEPCKEHVHYPVQQGKMSRSTTLRVEPGKRDAQYPVDQAPGGTSELAETPAGTFHLSVVWAAKAEGRGERGGAEITDVSSMA